jgi:hypothetical protein
MKSTKKQWKTHENNQAMETSIAIDTYQVGCGMSNMMGEKI